MESQAVNFTFRLLHLTVSGESRPAVKETILSKKWCDIYICGLSSCSCVHKRAVWTLWVHYDLMKLLSASWGEDMLQWVRADSYGGTDKCWCSVWQWQMLMNVVRAAVCSVQLCLHSEPGSVLCCCSVSVHGADWEDGSTHWTPVWCCCFNWNWTLFLLISSTWMSPEDIIIVIIIFKYHCDH